MMSMAGMDDDEDTFAPVVKSARKRSIWLGANVLAALAARNSESISKASPKHRAMSNATALSPSENSLRSAPAEKNFSPLPDGVEE